MKKNPLVSIVLPTKNEENYIGLLLDSLSKQTYKNFEVIVVDGNSKDKTVKIAKSYGARVIQEYGKYRSLPNARNIGIKNAKGDIVAVFDADTNMNKDFIKRAVETFTDDNIIGVKCRMVIPHDTFLTKVESAFLRTKVSSFTVIPIFWRKGVLQKIGMYDPSLGFGEDRDFRDKYSVFMQKNKKYKEGYAKDSVIVSNLPTDMKRIVGQQRWYGRTIMHYLKKRKGLSKYYILIKAGYPLMLLSIFWFWRISYWQVPFIISLPFLFISFLRMLKVLLSGNPYGIFIPAWDFVTGSFFLKGLMEYYVTPENYRGK